MTSRERLMSIFNGDIPDRSAILLGGIPDAKLPHPDYLPVEEMARKVCDLRASAYSPFDLYWGKIYLSSSSLNSRVEGMTRETLMSTGFCLS